MAYEEPCSQCQGTGILLGTYQCNNCQGTGQEPEYIGFRVPISQEGLKTAACWRCGASSSTAQWRVPANGQFYVTLCGKCDVLLNAWVLDFLRIDKHLRAKWMREYRASKYPAGG